MAETKSRKPSVKRALGVSTASIPTLIDRAQRLQLLGAEIAPQLHSTAMTGSMLEGVFPDRGEYLTDFQRLTEGRAREFGKLAVALSDDLRKACDVKDMTLAEAWRSADMEPPDSDLVGWSESGLVDLAASLLFDYGRSLSDWYFGNPDWRKWTKAALVVTTLAVIALGGVTIVLALTGGAAAVGVIPLVVANAGTTVANGGAVLLTLAS